MCPPSSITNELQMAGMYVEELIPWHSGLRLSSAVQVPKLRGCLQREMQFLVCQSQADCVDTGNVERRGMDRETSTPPVVPNFVLGIQYMLSKKLQIIIWLGL